jgi:hypothetical protein
MAQASKRSVLGCMLYSFLNHSLILHLLIMIIQIVLYFLGPNGLEAALPQGGQMAEDYPANPANHIEGLLILHWNTRRIQSSTLSTPADVTQSVCQLTQSWFSSLQCAQ